MKRIFLSILLGLSLVQLYCQEAANYQALSITVLPAGDGEGQVGYRKSFAEGGGYPGPTDYAFSPTGELYVADRINSRIEVFDESFRFVRSFQVGKLGQYPIIYRLRVSRSGQMLAVAGAKNVYVLGKDGKVLFMLRQDQLPDQVTRKYDVFSYGEGLLYTDDSFNYHILDSAGRELTGASKVAQWDSMLSEIGKLYKSEKGVANQIADAIRAAGIVWDSGRLLTSDFKRLRRLWQELRSLSIASRTVGKDAAVLDTVLDATFLGFDADANGYWLCFAKPDYSLRFVTVMSPLGDMLGYFVSDLLKSARPVVAPNGDIYLMVAGEDGVSISRIERVW